MKKRLPRSIRKYIRGEKARIRREVFDLGVEKDLIRELYERFLPKKKEKSEGVSHEQQKQDEKKQKGSQEKHTPHRREKRREKKKSKISPKTPTKSKPKPSSRSKKVTKKKVSENS